MENSITFTTKFMLSFQIKSSDLRAVEMALIGYKGQKWERTKFECYYRYYVRCNIRQAEFIRKQLQDIKIYD